MGKQGSPHDLANSAMLVWVRRTQWRAGPGLPATPPDGTAEASRSRAARSAIACDPKGALDLDKRSADCAVPSATPTETTCAVPSATPTEQHKSRMHEGGAGKGAPSRTRPRRSRSAGLVGGNERFPEGGCAGPHRCMSRNVSASRRAVRNDSSARRAHRVAATGTGQDHDARSRLKSR